MLLFFPMRACRIINHLGMVQAQSELGSGHMLLNAVKLDLEGLSVSTEHILLVGIPR